MEDRKPVLEFEHVAHANHAAGIGSVSSIDFVLRQGELARVRVADVAGELSVADLAQGFAEPAKGAIRFCGQSWGGIGVAQTNALRGRIGRISPDFGWISNLDLEENVTLGQRHRTSRPVWEIRAEARRWAQAFGLPGGIPPGRPSGMPRDILHRAACVRAFLGEPALIVIELWRDIGWTALSRPLADACQFLRGRKAAVLWITDHPDDAGQADLRPTVDLSLPWQ